VLKTKCPSCSAPVSYEWGQLNSGIVKFHNVTCAWCGVNLKISKKWLGVIILSIFTLPIGLLGFWWASRIGVLEVVRDI